jgi:opacity protein-like surface antigen
MSFLKTTKSIGGEMEVFISDRFSLALGAEFGKSTPSDVRFSEGDISNQFVNARSAFETKASLIPILGTVRINIPFKKFRAYIGAGAGLYLGKLRINWQSHDFADERFYAKGMAIIPHLNGGLSYKLSKRISVGFDVRYVMGDFNSLTIKECADDSLVGQKLNLTDINTYSTQFPWELKGLNMGFIVRFNF